MAPLGSPDPPPMACTAGVWGICVHKSQLAGGEWPSPQEDGPRLSSLGPLFSREPVRPEVSVFLGRYQSLPWLVGVAGGQGQVSREMPGMQSCLQQFSTPYVQSGQCQQGAAGWHCSFCSLVTGLES